MKRIIKTHYIFQLQFVLFFLLMFSFFWKSHLNAYLPTSATPSQQEDDYIKWVDFQVSLSALQDAYTYDVETYETETHLNWIELLAYLGATYGGDFSSYQKEDMANLAAELSDANTTLEKLTADMDNYDYYLEAYSAVLDGMVGEYKIQIPKEEGSEEVIWTNSYGLKAFSPIAKGFEYQDYDDFGVSRSYGYKRQHLGHDMMGLVGTPVTAVESGYVEAIGWNQYGGWRLGIRSFDGKRYYYYAHLRKDFPYSLDLEEGGVVQAGDVIGYLGRTGYSPTENTNNIDTPHLHFGIQLIFHESQIEGNNEIWIDCYALTQFLSQNQALTVRNDETKEWKRVYEFIDPAAKEYQKR